MKQQDSLILQLRAAEQSARTDVRGMKKTEAEESSNRHLNEQLLVEAEQKIKLAEYSVETSKKRNTELQSRCDELSVQWETERKLRYYFHVISPLFKSLNITDAFYHHILHFGSRHSEWKPSESRNQK